ncbi:hypothetical protein D3C85_1043990 [compost metagenome]
MRPAPDPDERTAPGDRRQPTAAALPAETADRHQYGVRQRSPGALAAPAARPAAAQRLHQVGRERRADHPAHLLGARRGAGPELCLASGRRPSTDLDQSVGPRPARPQAARTDSRRLLDLGRRTRLDRIRADRKRADGRPGSGAGDPDPTEEPRQPADHRRLRHRLFLAGLPAEIAGGFAEDRPVLRHSHAQRRR